MGEGVSTWGPWTAASHWAIEPVYGYDIYTVTLADVGAVTCTIPGYTGSSRIYDGGFIALSAGDEIAPSDIASTSQEQITVIVDKEEKIISVTAGATGIKEVNCEADTTATYDLAGRRLQEITAPGIYIVNGKKYIKK
jgi:hypothetical protein